MGKKRLVAPVKQVFFSWPNGQFMHLAPIDFYVKIIFQAFFYGLKIKMGVFDLLHGCV